MPASDGTANPKPAVGLFAKPPVPGRVKTRLVPPLRPEEAAALYAGFLADTACTLAGRPEWAWFVYSTDPGAQAAAWPEDLPRPAAFRIQRGADLGARMEAALTELLEAGHPAAVLVGSDHPTLPPTRIADAFAALGTADLVLGPSRDGGYYLVGLRSPRAGLFDGVAWSTPHVLADTRARADRLGLRTVLLDPWYDVDEPGDLEHLRRHLVELRRSGADAPVCPATWAVLEGLDSARLSGS